MKKKRTDKERLDWIEKQLNHSSGNREGIGITQFGYTFTGGAVWPNSDIRYSIDAAMNAEVARKPRVC